VLHLRSTVSLVLLAAWLAAPRVQAQPEPPVGDAPEAPDTWGSGKPQAPGPGAVPPGPEEDPDGLTRAPPAGSARMPLPGDDGITYTLEAIDVRGNTRTRSRVILRYVPFQAGDVINVDDSALELARYRLLGTGFFRDVQFALRKGSERGRVVLVIEVAERNTIIVNDLWMGLSKDADTRGAARPLTSYAGLDIAETNIAGTGITLGSAIGIAQDQLALRVRFLDPSFLGGAWMVSTSLQYNHATDFFGNSEVRHWSLDDPTTSRRVDYAIVPYKRFGGTLGVGRDVSVATQIWAHYRLETISAHVPIADHVRGTRLEPVLFDIIGGRSILSTLRGTVQHDTRDHPFLPTRGWFVLATGEAALSPLSDYSFQRFDVDASRWWELPWDHVLRLQLFGGVISGDAPFFEQYYIGDFSDFRPGRMLGLAFDRRPAPNFLDNSIAEIRYGHYAAKLSGEYRIPLFRGTRSVYGIDLFASAGIFALASQQHIDHPPRGYSRGQLVPIDLTGNVGFRMDTSAGGFTFAFSNVLGLIPPISSTEEQ
jgi:outer membrane protein insertion porin family